MSNDGSQRDYVFRGETSMERLFQGRTAGVEAGFLMPYLHEGMSLVDVGCGQGTITVGLAEFLAPGRVAGFDLQASQIDHSKELATARGLTNTDFRTGDIFDPPVAREGFDIAYANAVVSHLARPDEAVQSMASLVKPGGLIALRDRGGHPVISGNGASLRRLEIGGAVIQDSSRNPYGSQDIGLVLNAICRKQGLVSLAVSASWQILTSSHFKSIGFLKPVSDQVAEQAKKLGVTNDRELEELQPDFDAWLADEDAFFAVPWFEVVARKP